MLIDTWDVETFDSELLEILSGQSELIVDYMTTSRRLRAEREASDHRGPVPTNPHGGAFVALKEDLEAVMKPHSIRAWHYTRLTDGEVETLRQGGVHLSTLQTIRRRFDAQVAAGGFSAEVADALFAASPFQGDQRQSRSNKFWMVSHPAPITDGGVELLLSNWGGEAAYFWLRDPVIEAIVAGLGKPRVVELAVPLAWTAHSFSAGEAVIAAYGRKLGCRWEENAFDLYTTRALPAEAVLAVHAEGQANFAALARGYPERYVDPDDE